MHWVGSFQTKFRNFGWDYNFTISHAHSWMNCLNDVRGIFRNSKNYGFNLVTNNNKTCFYHKNHISNHKIFNINECILFIKKPLWHHLSRVCRKILEQTEMFYLLKRFSNLFLKFCLFFVIKTSIKVKILQFCPKKQHISSNLLLYYSETQKISVRPFKQEKSYFRAAPHLKLFFFAFEEKKKKIFKK